MTSQPGFEPLALGAPQVVDRFFPVLSVERGHLELVGVEVVEAMDVDIDVFRMRPRPVERMDPTSFAEMVLGGVRSERVCRERFLTGEELEAGLGDNEV